MPVNNRSAICIIGMHRSGTSMVARLLQRLGLELGRPEDLWGPDPDNPLGQFEHREFLDINEGLLARLGGSWDRPPNFTRDWYEDHSLDGSVHQANRLVEGFAANATWGWKEPRTTILLPFWKRIVPDLRFVICIRNPLEVAWSLAKRNGISIEQSGYLWRRYTRAALEDTEGCSRVFVSYENFFVDPRPEIEKLIKFCGLLGQQGLASDSEIVVSELRHHKSKDRELLGSNEITLETKLIYLGLRWLSHGERENLSDSDSHGFTNTMPCGLLLQFIDALQDQSSSIRWERLLAERNNTIRQLERVLDEKTEEISHLKKDLARLQEFSDAVRQTRTYKFYRSVIKPFRAGPN